MTHAYQEIYLSNAQALLGDAFDYAINACGVAGDSFIKLFSVSSVSNRIENGEPSYLLGKSGIETAVDVLVETTGKAPTAKPQANFSRSREYWIGWAVAYYQWFSGRKFSDIFKVLSFEDLQQMYSPLHEADVTKFADIVDAKVREYFADTNLKRIRTLYGCTQAELAKRSNVSLRSIQMYEQRNKDINRASAETVLSLAKVLGCTMEDLLEEIVGNIYDEFDSEEPPEIVQLEDNLWRISGGAYVEDIAEALDLDLPEDIDYDTLGGMIFSCLRIIPADGSQFDVQVNGLNIHVEKMEDQRVESALVSKILPEKEEEE